MNRPTLTSDAYEDDVARVVPLVFLAGPIRHWWTCWGSPEHEDYLVHRARAREALIEAGYLTYAPWDAIKGTWTESAQAVNNAAIEEADLMLVLTPEGVPAHGTAAEVVYAARVGTPVGCIRPGIARDTLLDLVRCVVGPGHPYEEASS